MPERYTHQPRHEPRDRGLRAGDRDRDAVADILREQHLAGRLETEEFQERLDRGYAAKTYGELDELVADLPGDEPTRAARRAWRWPAMALVPLLIAAIVLSRGHALWLAIPLFFFVGRPLLWRSAGHRRGWGLWSCAGKPDPAAGGHI
jgi:Domain of unknown function (DUF1707)